MSTGGGGRDDAQGVEAVATDLRRRDRTRSGRDGLARFDEAFVKPEPAAEAPRPAPATFAERAVGPPPSPLDRIDHLFHHTPRRIWLGLAALAVFIGVGVVWTAVVDRVVTVQSQAVIAPPEGLFTVRQAESGQIVAIAVDVGDGVSRGQQLAEINVAGSLDAVPVESPVDGVVVVVGARDREVVAAGSTLFVIAPVGSEIVAIGLFPAGAVSALEVGQQASVTVNGVAPDRFGRIRAEVQSVGDIPVAPSRLLQLTGDSSLVSTMSQQGPLYEVIVGLVGADTPSGVAWTRGDGPAQPIPIGALAGVTVIVDRQALIESAVG